MASELPPFRPSASRQSVIFRALSLVAAAALSLALPAGSVRGQQPPAPPAPAALEATALFNGAVTAFDRGDYQGAVTSIESLVKQIPADLPPADKAKLSAQLEPIFFTLGAAYFNLKQFPQASTALRDYLARYPRSARAAEATFSLAQASYFSKDYEAAAKSFANLEHTPAYREQALLLQGLSYKEIDKIPEAIAPLERLTAGGIKSPAAARGAMQLVLLHSRNKQPEKALAMLSAVQANIDQLENVVELNSVALEQGDGYLQNGANNEALTCYRAVRTREQVIALEHERIAALQKRLEANKLAARANPKEAPQYFLVNKGIIDSIAEDQTLVDTFAKLPTIYPKVLYRMARAFHQMGRPWEAIVAYQDSYERSSDPADREPALFGVITAYVDVNQPAAAREACAGYLKDFNQGANKFAVGYLLGATALQENDPQAAEKYFGRMLAEQPASTMREEMTFLLTNARFAQGKFDEARDGYVRYLGDFPDGAHVEEALFRVALGSLFGARYDDALKGVDDYLGKYPQGNFVSDAKYRRTVCKYALNKYDEVIADTRAWLKQYPANAQQGEVQALLGDAFAATGKTDDALAAYQTSYKTATTDEVLNYSLMEAGKILQKRGDWAADAAMFEDFVRTHPDHPTAVAALSQIGRAKAKEGKTDEAKKFLADTLKKYIDNSRRASVEQILDQLALLCVRKKPALPGPSAAPSGSSVAAAAASPAPAEAVPAPDPGAELDELLGANLPNRTPAAQARILYAKAQLARLRRQPAEVERNLLAIAAKFKPAVLSPTILGQVGDTLLSRDKPDEATPFYQWLLESFPKDDNVDFAYAGLGEIAFRKKQFDRALEFFKAGTDKIAANQKLKDLTVGQGKTLLELGKLDEAKKILEQSAAVREWRGETTAYCVYALGQIETRQGHWAEANAYYQRVFVAYQRFLPWVAKAYLGSADSLQKLGKKDEAVKTYQEMLRNKKLTDFSESKEARARLQALGAG